jgi:hypothetical protein
MKPTDKPHMSPSSSAKADDPVIPDIIGLSTDALQYWIARSSQAMTIENLVTPVKR